VRLSICKHLTRIDFVDENESVSCASRGRQGLIIIIIIILLILIFGNYMQLNISTDNGRLDWLNGGAPPLAVLQSLPCQKSNCWTIKQNNNDKNG
jgi:hypothetical protein